MLKAIDHLMNVHRPKQKIQNNCLRSVIVSIYLTKFVPCGDPANANGGRWLLTFGSPDMKLDDLWQETLLGMIGDCFSHDSDPQPLSRFITGCVVSIRVRGHKMGLWLSEAQNPNIVREIGRRWKSMMNLPSTIRIQFETHNESGSAQQKPIYEE
ncbi:unnamed protein product [Rotaria sp. Silwood2]|nr:unnamed protein product [Rotaria sp. Silwood2]